MSTKIYRGHRLPRSVDLFEFTKRARELADAVRDHLDDSVIIRAAVTALDRWSLGLQDPPPSSFVAHAVEQWDNEQRKMSRHEHGHDPHRFEMAFMAPTSTQTDWLAVIPYFDDDGYLPVIKQLGAEFGLERYPYWDNSDAPKDVTAAEWKTREKFWDEAVGRDAPARRGVYFELRGEDEPLLLRTAVDWRESPPSEELIPPVDERALAVRRHIALGIAERGRAATDKNAYALYMDTLNALDAGGKELDAVTTDVIAHHLRPLTIDTLRTNAAKLPPASQLPEETIWAIKAAVPGKTDETPAHG